MIFVGIMDVESLIWFLFVSKQNLRIFFPHVFVFLMQNTTIIIRAAVVVKSNYVEMRIRRYLCKSGPRSGAGFAKISTNSYLYVMGFHHDGCSCNSRSILLNFFFKCRKLTRNNFQILFQRGKQNRINDSASMIPVKITFKNFCKSISYVKYRKNVLLMLVGAVLINFGSWFTI